MYPIPSKDRLTQTLLCHICYLYSCSQYNHRVVLHKDLPNHSSTQNCGCPIVTRGTLFLRVEEAKITRMLTVVVVGFYLCWLPQVIIHVLLAVDLIEETSIKYRIFYLSFPIFTSSVINPIIYATTSQSFRNEFLKTVRRRNFPFRKRSLPFETVVAIHNSRCHFNPRKQ